MICQNPNILFFIPARGGSRRVPRKNIRLLGNHPVLAYTILAAKESRFNGRVVVSTEDEEIAKVASLYGAEVPYRRPIKLAEDVPTEDVVMHGLDWLSRHEQYEPDLVVTLEPTAPFRKTQYIDDCIQMLIDKPRLDSVLSIHKLRGGRPEWMLRLKENGELEPYSNYFSNQDAILKFPASQEFEPLYQMNGIVFASRPETIYRYNSLVGIAVGSYEIDKDEAFDINWPSDMEAATVNPIIAVLDAKLFEIINRENVQ